MKTREYLAIKRRIDDFELSEALVRSKLMHEARAGDPEALSMLRERYGLRLPLIEEAFNLSISPQPSSRN
jgi:hypothetical protein